MNSTICLTPTAARILPHCHRLFHGLSPGKALGHIYQDSAMPRLAHERTVFAPAFTLAFRPLFLHAAEAFHEKVWIIWFLLFTFVQY